jgi:hypothetical protein
MHMANPYPVKEGRGGQKAYVGLWVSNADNAPYRSQALRSLCEVPTNGLQ